MHASLRSIGTRQELLADRRDQCLCAASIGNSSRAAMPMHAADAGECVIGIRVDVTGDPGVTLHRLRHLSAAFGWEELVIVGDVHHEWLGYLAKVTEQVIETDTIVRDV